MPKWRCMSVGYRHECEKEQRDHSLSRTGCGSFLRVRSFSCSDACRTRGMGLADERLHAAAESGDVEQLQVTWSDQFIPRRAADARSSDRSCVWCSCGWERGPSSRTKTGTALHSPGQPFEHALRALLPLRSTGTRHTHWLVSASNPALGVFYQRNNPRRVQRLDAFSGKGGRRSHWRQWPVIRQWSRF